MGRGYLLQKNIVKFRALISDAETSEETRRVVRELLENARSELSALGDPQSSETLKRDSAQIPTEMILAWDESFSIGHSGLDADDRRIVALINEIGNAVRLEVPQVELMRTMGLLRLATAEHIEHESAILWQIGTGTYEDRHVGRRMAPCLQKTIRLMFSHHIREHQAMLARLNLIARGPVGSMCDSLRDWFVEHVYGQDGDLKALFQAVG